MSPTFLRVMTYLISLLKISSISASYNNHLISCKRFLTWRAMKRSSVFLIFWTSRRLWLPLGYVQSHWTPPAPPQAENPSNASTTFCVKERSMNSTADEKAFNTHLQGSLSEWWVWCCNIIISMKISHWNLNWMNLTLHYSWWCLNA